LFAISFIFATCYIYNFSLHDQTQAEPDLYCLKWWGPWRKKKNLE